MNHATNCLFGWKRPTLRIVLSAALAALPFATGCDQPKSSPTSSQAPAAATPPTTPPTAIAATAPTTEPAQAATAPASQPAAATLMVNQILQQFPEARLRLVLSSEHNTAILFSADPVNAINDDYKGNSFYLTMTMLADAGSAAAGSLEWRFKSYSSKLVDNTEGIFLEGLRYHLEPMDVIVRIEGSGPVRKVRLAGQFMAFDMNTPNQPGVLTPVSGEMDAQVDVKQ